MFLEYENIGDEDVYKHCVVIGLNDPQEDDNQYISSIPAANCQVILAALGSMNISSPIMFQVEAIHGGKFNSALLLSLSLRPKTGSGKTALPLGVGLLRWGVTIMLVSLIGLGAAMVKSISDFNRGIKAYHLDKYKEVNNYCILKNRLHDLHCDRVSCCELVYLAVLI